MRMAWMAALLTVVGLGGCETMSQDECLTADWRAIGFEDGTSGRPPSRIADHRKACAQHGVTPDLDRWSIGYDEGLERFCTPESGFSVGVSGGSHNGVCVGARADAFMPAFLDGQRYYGVKSALDTARGRISSVEHRLDEIDRKMDQLEAELRDPALPQEDRDAKTRKLKEFAKEEADKRRERDDLIYSLGGLERDLGAVRAELSWRYPAFGGW